MSRFRVCGAVEWALMAGLVFGRGALAQEQPSDADAGGPVIQIGESDPENTDPKLPPPDNDGLPDEPGAMQLPAAPGYWIGLAGGPIAPDHPLRAHVQLPESQGILVASVVPDGPAAKAGVKSNDILLRANDIDLREMADLVDLVITEGEKKGQIDLEILRRGERETVYVTPEVRPAEAQPPRGHYGRAFGPGLGIPGGVELPREWLPEFAERPFEFRQFGPGVILGGRGADVADLPSGVAVTITKENDKPAQITVKRGGETWSIVGDDPQSLEQLPNDVRPFVEQLLHGQPRHGLNLRGPGRAGLPELGDGRLRERLERMERRMQELQERLLAPDDDPADEQRADPDDSK